MSDVDCQRVLIATRVRPATAREGACTRLEPQQSSGTILLRPPAHGPEAKRPTRRFLFDRVFGPESTQAEVYRGTAASAAFDVLQGINSVVLAYGMTGAGKTYTTFGPSIDSERVTAEDASKLGLIPRAMFELFEASSRKDASWKIDVSVSFLQVYMGSVQDLLVGLTRPANGALAGLDLPVREGPHGTYVEGLSRHRAGASI